MSMTVKQLKESLFRKRRRNIILGIVTLMLATILWIAITNSIIWLVIFKTIISLISICLFLFAYVYDKNLKTLEKETTPDKSIIYGQKDKFTICKRDSCKCAECQNNWKSGKK